MDVDGMRSALAGRGYGSAQEGDFWRSRCPCCQEAAEGFGHDGARLLFREGPDRRLWVDCEAGCDGRRVRLLVGDPTAKPMVGRRKVTCLATDTCVDRVALYEELGRDS